MSAIRIRLVSDGPDADVWLRVRNDVHPAPLTAAELAAYRDALAADTQLLALFAGAPAGAAFGGVEPAREHTALGWIGVLAEHREAGVGRALHEALAEWSRRAGVEALEGSVVETDAASAAWTARRGYAEVGRESWVALDLRALAPLPVEPPPGVEIVRLAERPELVNGLYEVAREAVPDIPGHEEAVEPLEDWVEHELRGPNDDPEAIFVALVGSEVVGYAKFHLPRATPSVAVHDLTGVKRAWRRRGVAGALKRAQIAWAKAEGFERLETANEIRNLPIRKLNEELAYVPFRGEILVRRRFPWKSSPNALQSE